MRAQYVAGDKLDALLDPDDAAWQAARPEHLKLEGTPLGLQPTGAIRSSWFDKQIGAVAGVDVTAIHDGRHLAFRLEWNDPTKNLDMDDNNRFADAAAVALPSLKDAPLVTMGAPGQPVNAWYWRADDADGMGRHVVSEGLGTTRTLDQTLVRSRGAWKDGRWRVVIARALRVESAEPVAQLIPGSPTGFGVAIWEGGSGERAGIKAVSGFEWQVLELDALPTAGR
jgi:DMSO reductase family type II enzyme heme b subunit